MLPTLITGTVFTGTVLSVAVDLADPRLPRTVVTVDSAAGERQFVLPGANGPPVVVGGVPTILPGQTWLLELEETSQGLVPRRLGAGMDLLAGPVAPPWNLNGLHYDPDQLPLVFYLNDEGSTELGLPDTQAVAERALAAWSEVGCSSFAFSFGGLTAQGFEDDQMNVLSWENETWDWGGEVAGLTATRFDTSTGEVRPVGADIVFNAVDWGWTLGDGDVYLANPLLNADSVVVHELGHVTGMDHEMHLVSSTMFFAYIGGDWQGSLAGDDRRGLCENYGTGEAECSGDEDCVGIDDEARACTEIDGLKVCDQAWAEVGEACSRTSLPCREYCVFTNNQATEGYCSQACETADDCPDGYSCETPSLFVYDEPNVDQLLCVSTSPDPDTGDGGGETGEPQADGGAADGGAADTGSSDEAGCGCAASAPPVGLLLILPAALASRRRRLPLRLHYSLGSLHWRRP